MRTCRQVTHREGDGEQDDRVVPSKSIRSAWGHVWAGPGVVVMVVVVIGNRPFSLIRRHIRSDSLGGPAARWSALHDDLVPSPAQSGIFLNPGSRLPRRLFECRGPTEISAWGPTPICRCYQDECHDSGKKAKAPHQSTPRRWKSRSGDAQRHPFAGPPREERRGGDRPEGGLIRGFDVEARRRTRELQDVASNVRPSADPVTRS